MIGGLPDTIVSIVRESVTQKGVRAKFMRRGRQARPVPLIWNPCAGSGELLQGLQNGSGIMIAWARNLAEARKNSGAETEYELRKAGT